MSKKERKEERNCEDWVPVHDGMGVTCWLPRARSLAIDTGVGHLTMSLDAPAGIRTKWSKTPPVMPTRCKTGWNLNDTGMLASTVGCQI